MLRVVLVSVALFGATASAEPRGRIVTIARDREVEKFPLLCEISSDTSGTCLGAPRVGEVITVVDAANVIAEVEVTKVDRGMCGDLLTQITTSLRSGSMQNVRRSGVIGVSGRGASSMRKMEEDRVASPSSSQDEHVVLAVDRDGDAAADIVLTRGPCDAQNRGQCLETWLRPERQRNLQRVAQINLETCR